MIETIITLCHNQEYLYIAASCFKKKIVSKHVVNLLISNSAKLYSPLEGIKSSTM